MRLFAGDDWAAGHHDVEVMDEAGMVLARRRLPEGAAGIAQLHRLVGDLLGGDAEDGEVHGATGSSKPLDNLSPRDV